MNTQKKKLIEVSLPLAAINKASAKEKSIRHGNPSTLHLWWARRPLAAARAVIFAQMVDDPSSYPDLFKTEKSQEKERQRLFKIIEELVKWENTSSVEVLQKAREEIWLCWRRACAENADHLRANELFDRNKLPAFHDPFAGGGALPLEAQRLGLEVYASDLNPVAVLINKAMIEIPPKFANKPPVNPEWQKMSINEKVLRTWEGAQGLAEDVGYYGQWMRDEAEKRIGHLYPKIEITTEMGKNRSDLRPYIGKSLTVIAWLWARTVKSPNPAFANVDVPLATTFMLSTKVGKEAYVEPVIKNGGYYFTVKVGKPKDAEATQRGTKLSRGANFQCLMSGTPMVPQYIKDEGKARRMGARLMAIVAEGEHGRVYLAPTPEMETIALTAQPMWKPETPLPADMRSHWTPPYGLATYGDLFSPRQLVALTTFSDLIQEAHEKVNHDAIVANLPNNEKRLINGGLGAVAYADALSVYLAFSIDKAADYWSTICTWHSGKELIRNTFGRQAIPMSWDYVETNIFSDSSGNFSSGIDWAKKVLYMFPTAMPGYAFQSDAQTQKYSTDRIISTDPPYYDNIGYADLSDFFYVWLRRSLKSFFPCLFSTLAVPKAEELVATPYRHGSKKKAEMFFLDGMTKAMHRIAELAHPGFPITIYYAFKQAESDGANGTINTGWDTFLAAVIEAGFAISGTWPMRTELGNRMVGSGTNALASSIILVCRPHAADAPTTTHREFVSELKAKLPHALTHLQRGNIAPVDFAQAAIGPGMAIFCRFKKIVEVDGSAMSIRTALQIINQELDTFLAQQEEEMDPDTRFCLTWFEQYGKNEGPFGEADVLARAKNSSVQAMAVDEIIKSRAGKVRLVRSDELKDDWDPEKDKRLTVWECTQHLIRRLNMSGEEAAAQLVARLGGSHSEEARALAYRLFSICEKKKWAQDALDYNSLVIAWPEIMKMAIAPQVKDKQGRLF